jgi:hypothetical protein
MPRLLKEVLKRQADDKSLTPGEVADEIEEIRIGLRLWVNRLDKLTWALMTSGVKPGKIRKTGDDIPF